MDLIQGYINRNTQDGVNENTIVIDNYGIQIGGFATDVIISSHLNTESIYLPPIDLTAIQDRISSLEAMVASLQEELYELRRVNNVSD